MDITEYLKKHQPIVYNTIANAIEKDQISHAYLLSGSPGMPLKEIALFLAKSLVCENADPLACNHCLTCMRIDEGVYTDLKVFGGEKGKIKKEDIQNIIESFSSTAVERAGKVIYVLHLVEAMTPVAVNSLLKFLEEPGKDVYAFLTTENESKVLPTIISRTQVLKLKAIERDVIIEEACTSGVNKDDAELLSALYNDGQTIKEISENETYKTIKAGLNELLDALTGNKNMAIFAMEKEVIPVIKSYESAKMFLLLLATVFQDLLNCEYKSNVTLSSYANIINELSNKLKHISDSLREIMSARNSLEYNVNIPLLLDHVVYEITKED